MKSRKSSSSERIRNSRSSTKYRSKESFSLVIPPGCHTGPELPPYKREDSSAEKFQRASKESFSLVIPPGCHTGPELPPYSKEDSLAEKDSKS